MKRKIFVSILLACVPALMSVSVRANEENIELSNNGTVQGIYDTLKEGVVSYSKSWKNGLISHKKKITVKASSVKYHYDELLFLNTGFTAADTIEYTSTKGYTVGYALSTSKSISQASESAIKVGAAIEGAELSASQKMSTSYTVTETVQYSFSYTESLSISEKFNKSNFDIPDSSSWCIATIGDYISFSVEIQEIKKWWGKWENSGSVKKIDAEIITFVYKTAYFSDGTFASLKSRC